MLEDGLHGARERDRSTVEKMQPGDLLLIYITEPYSEWIGIQRATGAPFVTTAELHGHHDLPLRIPAEWVAALHPGSGIGRLEAADAAHHLGGHAAPHRHSPKRVDPTAGRVIVNSLFATHRRVGSVVPVAALGPEYDDLLST